MVVADTNQRDAKERVPRTARERRCGSVTKEADEQLTAATAACSSASRPSTGPSPGARARGYVAPSWSCEAACRLDHPGPGGNTYRRSTPARSPADPPPCPASRTAAAAPRRCRAPRRRRARRCPPLGGPGRWCSGCAGSRSGCPRCRLPCCCRAGSRPRAG
ncbi:hypothetical protein VTK73DRAFT_4129 [Phialemonium thermophilum]|uniref:Uncharacterized protein n=1 Tax=Phialemonium thermophilum TaxID=223376 RepID=A0ABR3VB92_9PEZI